MVEVRVNGKTYSRVKQLDGFRSVDTFCGEIKLVTSEAPNNNSFIKNDDLVEVFLDSVSVFAGYVETIADSLDAGSHGISYTGRDKIADLIDSSVPENVTSLEGVSTFAELVQLCIDGLGLTSEIKVIDEVGARFTDSNKLKSASVDQTVESFLQDNARIVQVFLNTDGKGNVLIRKPSGKAKTVLQNIPGAKNNNIEKSSFVSDNSKRFYRYTVYSNSSLSDNKTTIKDLNNKGEAFDNEIRKTRIKNMVADKPMTNAECERAAIEQANIRRADSFQYNCQVAGFSANGELWEPGALVPVKDTPKGVVGEFQINSVKWSLNESGGETSVLDVTTPDKTEQEADPTPVTQRTTQNSSTYIVVKDDNLSVIAARFNVSLASVIAANPQFKNPHLIFAGNQVIIPTGSIITKKTPPTKSILEREERGIPR